MKATVYIATSLDGFIARPDGGIDWFDDPPPESGADAGKPVQKPDEPIPGDEEDFGFGDFMDTIDYIIMGRNTFDLVLSFGLEHWIYGDKPMVVLTSRPLDIPDPISGTVETMNCSPEKVVELLSGRGAGHLYVDGGETVQQFLRAGLIHRLIITRIPVLIGEGISLFGPLEKDIKVKHVNTSELPGGLTKSEYEVIEEFV
jgi:dihydrofolate reductase